MPNHEHKWTRLVLHGDGCHYAADLVECACGARAEKYRERDKGADPYEAVWFRDDCDRCRALAGGAKPVSETRVTKGGRNAARKV